MVTEAKPSSETPAEPIPAVELAPEPVEQPAEAPAGLPEPPVEAPEPTLEELRAEREQLRADLKAKDDEAKESFEKGRRKGQGDLDTEVHRAREAERVAIERRGIADQLEALYQQAEEGDPDSEQKFRRAMADTRYQDIWNARVRERSGQVDLGKVQADLIATTQLQLRENPKFKELGEDKIRELEKSSETWADFFIAAGLAIAEKETEKRLTAEKTETEQAVRSQMLEEERRKSGGVAELKGSGSGTLTPEKYKAMSDEARAALSPEQIDAMTSKYL